jgi:hypothetical protein
VSGVGLNYLPWGPDDDLHLYLALGESDRFSQAIGACDEHVRTTDDNAPCPNGGPGIARELQSPSAAFRALHEAGCFVIPNPWDVGPARYLQQLGFPALATTSAGFAFSQGLPDSEGALTCERNLAYIADIAGAVDVPVNADFASGYGASHQVLGLPNASKMV